MKTITIELPDTTLCSFLNYVFVGEGGGMLMGVKLLDTNDIKAGHVTVDPKEEA